MPSFFHCSSKVARKGDDDGTQEKFVTEERQVGEEGCGTCRDGWWEVYGV